MVYREVVTLGGLLCAPRGLVPSCMLASSAAMQEAATNAPLLGSPHCTAHMDPQTRRTSPVSYMMPSAAMHAHKHISGAISLWGLWH